MQVILKEDVAKLGKTGDLVTVKPGYGRNYLIPKGLALVATPGNMARIEHEKRVLAAKNTKLLKDAQAMVDRLAQVELELVRQVGEADRLFGSVTSRDIEEAPREKGGELDHNKNGEAEPSKTHSDNT